MTAEGPVGPKGAPSWGRIVSLMSIVVVAAPVLGLLVVAAGHLGDDWTPSQDLALVDLRVRDVGSADTPLLGPYSRFGWNHPGPSMFWLLAPLAGVVGGGASAVLVAAGVQNVLVLVAVALVARRVGGPVAQLVLGVGIALLCASLGGEVLTSTWNPWLVVLPLALLVVATWGVSSGDVALVPVVLGVGSYLVQTHIGQVPVVVAVVGAGVLLAVSHRRSVGTDGRGPGGAETDEVSDVDGPVPGRARTWWIVGASAAVVVVAWIGPVVDEFRGTASNGRAIVTHFLADDAPSVGLSGAVDVATRELSLIAPWAGGGEPVDVFGSVIGGPVVLAVPFLALFGLAGLRLRRSRSTWWSLWCLVAAGLLAAFVATSRITGLAHPYLVRSWWVLAMLGWVCVAVAWLPVGRRDVDARVDAVPSIGVAVAPVVSSIVAVAAAIGLVATAEHPSLDPRADDVVEVLVDRLEPGIRAGAVYELRIAGVSWGEYFFGLGNAIDAAGGRVVVDEVFAPHFGRTRAGPSSPEPDVVVVVATGLAVEDLVADPAYELLAEYDPLDPDRRAELVELQRGAIGALTTAGRQNPVAVVESASIGDLGGAYPELDPAVVERMAALLRAGDRVAVLAETGP